MRHAGKTVNGCAAQVGVSPVQVDRWTAGQDKVTPEMQDRIVTWLDRSRIEIFGETKPRDIDEATLQWATGLKAALKANRAGIDVPRLGQLVEQDVVTIQAWVDLKRQVDAQMQWRHRRAGPAGLTWRPVASSAGSAAAKKAARALPCRLEVGAASVIVAWLSAIMVKGRERGSADESPDFGSLRPAPTERSR